jgi:GT2 family glycosyltransferase
VTPKIYILLPVHNRRQITQGFVECLRDQTFRDYHLVLIDDGSSDGTAEMVLEHISSATVLRGNGSWWWSGSLQRGLEWLKEHAIDENALVLFINDDVEFSADYLERAVHVMKGKQGVLVLSRIRRQEGGQITETGIYADLRRLTFTIADCAERINCLSTRGLFAYWGDVRAIGGFHPKLLPHYLSDYEYTIRAHRKGYKCATSPELLIETNEKTTGYHTINSTGFAFLKRYFSKKSPANPLYWSSFVVLTAASIWAPVNLLRVWVIATKTIIRSFAASTRSCSGS